MLGAIQVDRGNCQFANSSVPDVDGDGGPLLVPTMRLDPPASHYKLWFGQHLHIDIEQLSPLHVDFFISTLLGKGIRLKCCEILQFEPCT